MRTHRGSPSAGNSKLSLFYSSKCPSPPPVLACHRVAPFLTGMAAWTGLSFSAVEGSEDERVLVFAAFLCLPHWFDGDDANFKIVQGGKMV